MDRGMTHKFFLKQEINQLGLELTPIDSSIKDVNSKVQTLARVACGTILCVGSRMESVDFLIPLVDDFDTSIDINFFVSPRVSFLPTSIKYCWEVTFLILC